jgi:hypothetical protein
LQCFGEADVAAQGIFTGELRKTKGRYSRIESPRTSVKTNRISTTDMSSSFPHSSYSATSLLSAFPPSSRSRPQRPSRISLVCMLAQVPSFSSACTDDSASGFQDILDEVLLAPAGGLDGRSLLDSLGAAAGKEEDAAEHRAENTHRELSCAACQPLYFDSLLHIVLEIHIVMRNPEFFS